MEDCLQQGWREIHQRGAQDADAESFETFWNSVLQAGVWGQDEHRTARAPALPRACDRGQSTVEAPQFSGASDAYPFFLHLYLSTALHDGRGANLPWMQELPDPLTSVVYGSWVELNPITAKAPRLERRGCRRCGIHAWSRQRSSLRLSGHPTRRRCDADRAGTWRVRPVRAGTAVSIRFRSWRPRSNRRPARSPGARRE